MLARLFHLPPVAEHLILHLLDDALGVLAMYTICQHDAGIKADIIAYGQCTELGLVWAICRALNQLRNGKDVAYTQDWNAIPYALVHHACVTRDVVFICAIHNVLDVRHVDFGIAGIPQRVFLWIDETCDEQAYRVLEVLCRRKAAVLRTANANAIDRKLARELSNLRIIGALNKYSTRILYSEFFRRQPHAIFPNAMRLLAATMFEYFATTGNLGCDEMKRTFHDFMESVCPWHEGGVSEMNLDALRQECTAILLHGETRDFEGEVVRALKA